MTSHTPGPWRYIEHAADSLSIVADDDRQSKTWKITTKKIIVERKPRTIAQINWMVAKGIGYHEAEANARLIAAAPKLLEACKNAFKLPRPWITTASITFKEWDAAISLIEEAITEAEDHGHK